MDRYYIEQEKGIQDQWDCIESRCFNEQETSEVKLPFNNLASTAYRNNPIIDQYDDPHLHNYEEYAFPDFLQHEVSLQQAPGISGNTLSGDMNLARRPFGFHGGGFHGGFHGGFGGPFLGGVLGGLVGSAFYNPYFYGAPYYYGYPYSPYGWY